MNEAVERSAHHLKTLFEPRSIALVGATEKSPWTGFIVRNFKDFGFDGGAFAVNRRGGDVMGLKGFQSCRDIEGDIDVAFIFVPQPAVIEAMEDAAAAGIRNAVILTSGYSETGPEGVELQQQLLDKAHDLGMNIWGPNSLGFNNVSAGAPVSSIPAALPALPPKIAIVSQSGATASELNEFAHSQNIGASFVAATGNEGQLSLADIVDYLVDHQPTRAIAVFAESIRNPEVFERAASRARSARKPIVMLKVGRSELASKVAMAHTGSLAGDDKVFDAVCERLGIIRVYSTEDLVNTAGLLAVTGPLPRSGLGFISISGGACTLIADGAEAAGVCLPTLSEEITRELQSQISDYASSLNPLDVTGAAVRDPSLMERLIPIVASAPDIGLLGINMDVPTKEGSVGLPSALHAIGRAVKSLDKPAVMITTTTKTLTDVSRSAIAEHGLPHIICGIDPALRAIANAVWWSGEVTRPARPLLLKGMKDAKNQVSPLPKTERQVLDYLSDRGVPVIPAIVASSRTEAEAITMEGPLVMKILSADIAHKTEVGGVMLNIATKELGASYDAIREAVTAACPNADIEGVIISPMREAGLELLVGITSDDTWGPILTVGFGGVLVEVLADVAIAPLPVSSEDVVAMLKKLRGAKLLSGYRNSETADMQKLADIIAAIGAAAVALGPELQSLEINPLLVRGANIEALDGLALWAGRTDGE